MTSVPFLRSSRVLVSMQVVLIGGLLMACGDDSSTREPDAGANPGTDGGTTQTDGQVTSPDGGQTTNPDGGTIGRMCGVTGGACDVIAQNCPDSTQGCYFGMPAEGGTPSTMCLGVRMTGGDGAECTYTNDCLPGFTCTPDNRCRSYCCMGASSDCPDGSGQRCVGLAEGENIGVCMPSANCNLVTSEGCTGGQACYVFDTDGSLGCFPVGTGAEGTSCRGGLNECAVGMGCLSTTGSDGMCVRYCRVSMMDADCGGGRMCQMVNGLSLPEDTGVCPPPAA